MADHDQVYRFAGFELDTGARLLRAREGPVSLQPRPFDLLRYLIENRDRVVTREELVNEVWGARVGPEALGFALHAVRRAISDDGARQTILKTVRGRGIQFVAAVDQQPSPLTRDRLRNRRSDPPFLGREDLVQIAEEALAAASVGEGSLLFLHGEAGIGKTRAIEHIASMAVRAGFKVYGGRCATGEGELAFSPWRQILQAATSGHTLESLSNLLGVVPADLAWIVARVESGAAREHDDPWTNSATRERLFDVVTALIAKVAREEPVLLSLDDAHHADSASLALLSHVGPALAELPVLLVAGYRDTDRTELSATLTELSAGPLPPRMQVHELLGLNAADVRTLVESILEVGIDPNLAVALTHRTNGNPFFVTTLLHVLTSQNRVSELGGVDLDALALPESVNDAVLLQLRDVPATTIEVLRIAAIAGREFFIEDIEHALQLERSELARLLVPAVGARILRQSSAQGAYSFVHALVRDVIIASLKAYERASLHFQLASGIEGQVRGREWLRAPELAHHFVQAAPVCGVDFAIRYLEIAADWASQNMGFEAAVTHLEALSEYRAFIPEVSAQCRIDIKLGSALNRLGSREKARGAFFRAIALSRRAGLGNYLAVSALLYSPDFLSLETGVVDHEHIEVLREALSVGSNSPEVRAQLLARLGVGLHWSDELLAEGIAFSRRSVSIASRCEDGYVQAYADTALRFAQFSVDNPEVLVRVDPGWGSNGAPLALLVSRVLRVTGYWLLGEMGKLRAEIEEFSGVSRVSQEARAEWYGWLWKASLALMEGRFGEAAAYQRKFSEVGDRAGDRNVAHSRILQHFLTCVDVGGVEPLGDLIEEVVEKYPRVVGWRAGRLHYNLELGNLQDAGVQLGQLIHERVVEKPRRNEWYGLAAAMSIAASRLENRSLGSLLYEKLEPLRHCLAVIGYGSFCYGSVAHLTALCAVSMGDIRLAKTEFAFALDVNRSVGAMPAQARVLVDLSALERDSGGSSTSSGYAQEAVRICRQLGMVRLGKKAERFV